MRISDWSSDVCSSDLVRARLQHLGDVVAVVEDGLAIIGPAWIEQRGGGLAPVDAELVMAEPADRDDRMANGLADSEAAPEQRHTIRAGIVGAFARFGATARPALVGGAPCRLPPLGGPRC